jgi:hypothetical protein
LVWGYAESQSGQTVPPGTHGLAPTDPADGLGRPSGPVDRYGTVHPLGGYRQEIVARRLDVMVTPIVTAIAHNGPSPHAPRALPGAGPAAATVTGRGR